MFKLLLITFLIIFIFVKVGGFIMRMLFSGFVKKYQNTSGQNHRQSQYKKPSDGNVNIDYIPSEGKKGKPSNTDFKGGDFVDYEEVK